jgi:hypothetical protein
MGRIAVVIAAVASSASIGGCGGGGTSLLGLGSPRSSTTSSSPTTSSPRASTASYVDSLRTEQLKLAAAERRIPARPRTPAALSQSITLLASAIGRLGSDLGAIVPPAPVAALHARLVATVRAYAVQLAGAARTALRPGGELAAANALLSATNTASRAFSATVVEIDRTLKR